MDYKKDQIKKMYEEYIHDKNPPPQQEEYEYYDEEEEEEVPVQTAKTNPKPTETEYYDEEEEIEIIEPAPVPEECSKWEEQISEQANSDPNVFLDNLSKRNEAVSAPQISPKSKPLIKKSMKILSPSNFEKSRSRSRSKKRKKTPLAADDEIGSPLNNPKSLQMQFSKATKDQEVIQKRYKELWSWHGQQTATIKFSGYQMQGYLKKFVEQVKVFQFSVYPKRYFIIDFTLACILIRKEAFGANKKVNRQIEADQKVIPFRDIQDCYLPKGEIDKKNLPKNWQFPFYIQTSQRLFVLCAKNNDERNMWMAGFRYVIASTMTVQCIMKYNNKVLDVKLKEKTEKFVKKQIQRESFQKEEQRKKTKQPETRPSALDQVHDEIEPFEGMELFKSAAQLRREQLTKSKSPVVKKETLNKKMSPVNLVGSESEINNQMKDEMLKQMKEKVEKQQKIKETKDKLKEQLQKIAEERQRLENQRLASLETIKQKRSFATIVQPDENPYTYQDKYKSQIKNSSRKDNDSKINFYSQNEVKFRSIEPHMKMDLNGVTIDYSETPKHLREKARINDFLQKRRGDSIDYQSIDASSNHSIKIKKIRQSKNNISIDSQQKLSMKDMLSIFKKQNLMPNMEAQSGKNYYGNKDEKITRVSSTEWFKRHKRELSNQSLTKMQEPPTLKNIGANYYNQGIKKPSKVAQKNQRNFCEYLQNQQSRSNSSGRKTIKINFNKNRYSPSRIKIQDEEQGGSVINNGSLDLDDQLNQTQKSIEIQTSSYVQTPNSNIITKKNSKITLKDLNDLSTLDQELSRLNGRVSKISTKLNEEGQRVKLIKIKKNKNNEQNEEFMKVLEKVRKKVHKNIKRNIDDQKSKIYHQKQYETISVEPYVPIMDKSGHKREDTYVDKIQAFSPIANTNVKFGSNDLGKINFWD